jgi:hypothetical protein
VGGPGCPPGPGEGAEPGRSRPGGQRPARLFSEKRVPPNSGGQGAGHPGTGSRRPLSIFDTTQSRSQGQTRPGRGILRLGTILPHEPVGGQTPRTEPTEGGPETAGEVLRSSGMTKREGRVLGTPHPSHDVGGVGGGDKSTGVVDTQTGAPAMPSKSTRPVTGPDVLDLTFRGLDLCDGCGARLEPGDRLSGLCPACLGAITKVPPGSRQGCGSSRQ